MKYFESFPKTIYNFNSASTSVNFVTNILLKNSFLQNLLKNTSVYYQYTIKDSDSAQIIADKYYGDSNRYWIVLLFNQMFDPYFDFPMNSDSFDRYIVSNYGSIQTAKQTLKQIEKTVTKSSTTSDGFTTIQSSNTYVITGNTSYSYDFTNNTIVSVSYPPINYPPVVTSTQYTVDNQIITLQESVQSLSVYDYEYRANENKRIINLLDSSYVNIVERQFKELLQNG
jgi:hypothetical protein